MSTTSVAAGCGAGGRARPKHLAFLLLSALSLVALIVAAIAVFDQGNGIAFSGGAYLVLCSTILLLVASLIVLLWRPCPGWLRGLLLFLIFLDLLGTGVAAYFLEASALLALMVLGFIAWLAGLSSGGNRTDGKGTAA